MWGSAKVTECESAKDIYNVRLIFRTVALLDSRTSWNWGRGGFGVGECGSNKVRKCESY